MKSLSAGFPLPRVLSPRGAYRLPLHVQNRVGSAAGERPDMVPDITGQAPGVRPGEGQGCCSWNSRATSRERCSLAETELTASAHTIAAPNRFKSRMPE